MGLRPFSQLLSTPKTAPYQLFLGLRASAKHEPALCEALDLAADDSSWAKVLCLNRGATDLGELRRQLPRRLEQVLARALAQAPERRPITALALAEEVKQSIASGLLKRILKKMRPA